MGNVPSGNSTAQLYQTGPKLASGVSGLFDLHEGVKKGQTAEKVSVFIFDPSKVSSEASTILSNAATVRLCFFIFFSKWPLRIEFSSLSNIVLSKISFYLFHLFDLRRLDEIERCRIRNSIFLSFSKR
jgi:hypothetical protein